MNYKQLEDDVHAKLTDVSSGLTGVDIEILPETEAAFKKPYEKGRITICYQESTFQKPISTAQIVQDEFQEIEIVLAARTRRGSLGVYEMYDKSSKALVGFQPTNCDRLYTVSFMYLKYETNVWYYSFKLACKDMLVEAYDDAQDVITTLIEVDSNETINPPTNV